MGTAGPPLSPPCLSAPLHLQQAAARGRQDAAHAVLDVALGAAVSGMAQPAGWILAFHPRKSPKFLAWDENSHSPLPFTPPSSAEVLGFPPLPAALSFEHARAAACSH